MEQKRLQKELEKPVHILVEIKEGGQCSIAKNGLDLDYIKHILWNYANGTGEIKGIHYDGDQLVFILTGSSEELQLFLLDEVSDVDEYWINRCKIANYDLSFTVQSRRDVLNELEQENRSGNELADFSSLQLPFTPYDFQMEDARTIVSHKRFLIGHEMGCGKTLISVLVSASIPGKKLVICPESLRLNWKREIERVLPNADTKILYSKDEFATGEDFTICGYQTAAKFERDLCLAHFTTLFCDEAHYIKSVTSSGKPGSKRAEAVTNISEACEYVYLLTGTPMPTRNKDLYNILKILNCPGLHNMKFFDFGVRYCDGHNNGFGWDFSGSSNSEELHEILSMCMVRRTKAEVLPNLTKQRQFIPLSCASRAYKKIESQLSSSDSTVTFMGTCQSGRLQLSLDKLNDCLDFADSILDQDEQVVIVSNFKETIEQIKGRFGDDCCTIVGGMSDDAKQKSVDDFQSGRKKVCAVNIVAGGVGVTLTKASKMIVCDFDWTPANMSQVEDRICRVGQENPCTIYYLYAEDAIMDRLFVDMITEKSSNIDRVIDNTENTMDLDSGRDQSFLHRLMEEVGFSFGQAEIEM